MSKSTYVTPQTTVGVFKDPGHRECIRQITQRLTELESVNSLQGFNSTGRNAALPARPQLSVTSNPAAVPGQFFVRITNPEYLQATTPRNPIRAPILHRLSASQTPDFSSAVVMFPVSVQTYFNISELGSGAWHFRVESSYDGKTFTQPVLHGAVTS